MAIEDGEHMHDCFPKHLPMGTARLKQDNETEEESKMRRMNVEEVQRTRKIEVLSSHFVVSSHVMHSQQFVSKSVICYLSPTDQVSVLTSLPRVLFHLC